MILVVIPYYDVPKEQFRKSVKSILNQSYKDYEVLIIGDGVDAKAVLGMSDPKLKYFMLEKNRGRYFADAVASLANPHEFYLPHDADDESSYDRLFYLMKKQQSSDYDVVYHCQFVKSTNTVYRESYPLLEQPLRPQMRHLAHWSGLYRSSVLKDIKIHPGFRVGFDTLLTNLIKMKYNVGIIRRFLYTRNIRQDSLTKSPKTGFGSPHRRIAVKKLVNIYDQCYKRPEKLTRIVNDSITARDKQLVIKEADRLKQEMGWL